MLFDLHGKRRRVVQVVYLTLAILMGGGLVLFGIGSDVQGGLADIFTGDGGDESGNPIAEEQLADAEERLQQVPDDPAALAAVVQANYQLATATDEEEQAAGELFAADATPRLEAAADAWRRYLATEPKRPDDTLAFQMVQVLGIQGLNEPEEAAEAAEIVAGQRRDPGAYLELALYSALAGDDRAAELAGGRAVSLAPKPQREQVQRQVDAYLAAAEQFRRQSEAQSGGGTTPGATPTLPGASPPAPGGLPTTPLPQEGAGGAGGEGDSGEGR